MLNLVLKDLVLQKKQLIFAALYSIFILTVFSNPMFARFVYVMGAIGIGYIMIMNVMALEEKNNTDIILNSLPLKRRDIVRSKYLSVFVSVGLALLLMAVFGFLFRVLALPIAPGPMQLQDAVIAFCSVGFLAAVYFPLYYLTAGKWIRAVNIILFMLVFFSPNWIVGYVKGHADQAQVMKLISFVLENVNLIYFAGLAVVLSLMAVSLFISLKVYERKDF